MPLFGPPDVKKLEAKRDVKKLIKAMGYKDDEKVRTDALEALGRIGAPAIEPLTVTLKDPDEMMRWRASVVLGEIGEAQVVEPLIGALKDSYEKVRGCSAVMLGRIGDAELRSVVGLMQGQGVVQMLGFGDFVLLQPEEINRYASVVVRMARDGEQLALTLPEV